MVLIGLWDDRVSLGPLAKIAGQIAAGVLLVLSGIQIRFLGIQAVDIALTLFWVVAISNAINFQDNMDGLAAGLSMVCSAFFFALALFEDLDIVALLAAGTVGASLGFLYYNFNPASLFMGDAGSLLLGFVLAVMGIKLEFGTTPLGVTWMIPIIVLGVPIFDTTLVIVSRLRRRRPIYQGGRDHTSHRLVVILKMSHVRAVMTLYMISGGLGLLAIMLRDATVRQANWLLAGLAVMFVGALVWLEMRFKELAPAQTETQPASES
jgi:UDP-GlcNAc:undecaprenyl-phosphate GlcNAc-1-phosphate transferase